MLQRAHEGACAIDTFRDKAYCLFVWRAFLVALLTLVLLITGNFGLRVSLVIGGNSALLFSLALLVYARSLNDDWMIRIEPWRLMQPSERPGGAGGRLWARNYLNDTALRFAEGASGVAIALLTSALLVASEQ